MCERFDWILENLPCWHKIELHLESSSYFHTINFIAHLDKAIVKLSLL